MTNRIFFVSFYLPLASTILKAPQASLHHGILTSVYIDSKLLKSRLFGVPIDGFRNLTIKESKIIDLEMLGSLREVFTVPNSAAGEPKMTYIGLSQRHPPRVGGVLEIWRLSTFIQEILAT